MSLDTSKKYKLSAKNANGKWWSYGRLEYNEQYGNWRIGMKSTDALQQLVNSKKDGYINFSLFEEEDKNDKPF